jgi:hypothetical protein
LGKTDTDFYKNNKTHIFVKNSLYHQKKNQMSAAEKKLELLERLMRLPYNEKWERLELVVEDIEKEIIATKTPEELLAKFAKPRKETIDLEALMKEQNYPKYDSKRAEELVREMDIQEPIEDLINMI